MLHPHGCLVGLQRDFLTKNEKSRSETEFEWNEVILTGVSVSFKVVWDP